MNVLKKSINLKVSKEGGLKKTERPEIKRNQENLKRPLPKSKSISSHLSASNNKTDKQWWNCNSQAEL
jgi:hypothetical protein